MYHIFDVIEKKKQVLAEFLKVNASEIIDDVENVFYVNHVEYFVVDEKERRETIINTLRDEISEYYFSLLTIAQLTNTSLTQVDSYFLADFLMDNHSMQKFMGDYLVCGENVKRYVEVVSCMEKFLENLSDKYINEKQVTGVICGNLYNDSEYFLNGFFIYKI